MADDLSAPDVSFAAARHGFDRAQVRHHVRGLTDRAQRAEADRSESRSQVAELQGELEIARREIAALSERLDALGKPADEQSATRLLAVARTQAGEITTRARAAADGTWAAAERASTELRDKYRKMVAELETQHAEIRQTHKSILSTARSQVEAMTTEAQRQREELDAEAERDRVRIDREFSERTSAQRTAFERELADRRAACVAEVESRLRAADEEAKRRVETVTAQVTQLTEVREELSERLREAHELLDRSVALLEVGPSESELSRENPLRMPEPPLPGAAAPADAEPADSEAAETEPTDVEPAEAEPDGKPVPPAPPTDVDGKRTVPPQRAKRSQAAKR